MKKLVMMVIAATVFAGYAAYYAEAMPMASLIGVRVSSDDVDPLEQVHCVPGQRHHRSQPRDGCYAQSLGPLDGSRYRRHRSNDQSRPAAGGALDGTFTNKNTGNSGHGGGGHSGGKR